MILADFLPPRPDHRWDYARQLGVTHAIVKMHPDVSGESEPWTLDALARVRDRLAEGGFTLAGLEGDPFPMDRIKLGLEGRQVDFDRYRELLRNLGKLEIPLLCYNFMAVTGWYRTRHDLRERGGAQVSGFRLSEVPAPDDSEIRNIPEARVWKAYARFVKEILPAAEEAGVQMALHPDDPPVSPLKGVGRIFTTAAAVNQALALSGSPSHALTFCQGSYRAMGEDVQAWARRWRDRIAFIHFRDVTGSREDFRETFHDNGPTDMAAMIRLYGALGLDVPIRVDHVPTLAGEENTEPGYAALGRLYAIGYLRGLCEAAGVELR